MGLSAGGVVSPQLRRLFEPQLEQLGLTPVEQSGGVFAAGANEVGEGSLWALQVSESCLVVSHDVTFLREFSLEEDSPQSLCVASLSPAGIPLCPFPQTPMPLRASENVAVFEQKGRSVSRLGPHDSFDSVAICVTPSFLDAMGARFGDAVARRAHALMGAPGGVCMGGSEPYVRAALRFAGSARDGSVAVRRQLARKAEGVIALLALEDGEARLASARAGSAADVRIASRVRCLIEADPAHPPSIEDMASLLSVGRARLCAVFKQETGESIGVFAARKRIELSCALLSDASLPVARVAQIAGYRHQSSFAEAFKRETGLSPREWRARELGIR